MVYQRMNNCDQYMVSDTTQADKFFSNRILLAPNLRDLYLVENLKPARDEYIRGLAQKC
ncbi:MAG: hypothetical protein SCALA701_17860 [Candidatus Scalindua sp.]|nr:MAG: hypothetical protein SCALA701_17860 [Candidatus Scalindua sp.]